MTGIGLTVHYIIKIIFTQIYSLVEFILVNYLVIFSLDIRILSMFGCGALYHYSVPINFAISYEFAIYPIPCHID